MTNNVNQEISSCNDDDDGILAQQTESCTDSANFYITAKLLLQGVQNCMQNEVKFNTYHRAQRLIEHLTTFANKCE